MEMRSFNHSSPGDLAEYAGENQNETHGTQPHTIPNQASSNHQLHSISGIFKPSTVPSTYINPGNLHIAASFLGSLFLICLGDFMGSCPKNVEIAPQDEPLSEAEQLHELLLRCPALQPLIFLAKAQPWDGGTLTYTPKPQGAINRHPLQALTSPHVPPW